jgi:hypothetical protein
MYNVSGDEDLRDAIKLVELLGGALAAAHAMNEDGVKEGVPSSERLWGQAVAMHRFVSAFESLVKRKVADEPTGAVEEFLADLQQEMTAVVTAGIVAKADVEAAAAVFRSLGVPVPARFLDEPVRSPIPAACPSCGSRSPRLRPVTHAQCLNTFHLQEPREVRSYETLDLPTSPAGCPTCSSPDPRRHPAVQHEGEVQECTDPFHGTPIDQIQDLLALVSTYVRRNAIVGWTMAQRELAVAYAAAAHLRAGDHADVAVPERPVFLPPSQSDIPTWWVEESSNPTGVVTSRVSPPPYGDLKADLWFKHGIPTGYNVRVVNALEKRDFTADALRRPGALGVVVGAKRGHGLYYEVRHDDLAIGHYDPDELFVVCRRCVDCPPEPDHHWIEGSIDPADEQSVQEFRDDHPGAVVTDQLILGHQECKHCPAVRPWQDPDDEDDEDEETDTAQDFAELRRKVFDTLARKQEAERERDNAYVERTHLIALVAAFCHQAGLPVGLGQHDPNDKAWDPAWRTIVYVEIPDGLGLGGSFQASWHISDRDRELVAYLPAYPKTWDGHSTREKYLRIAATAERYATGTSETVFARWNRAVETLVWLDRLGGLGHDKHEAIRKVLNPMPRGV